MYCFGDSTAFPLRDNFLETLTRTVRACASLFALECEMEDAEQQIHVLSKHLSVELRNHESIEVALNLALGKAQGTLATQTAGLLRQSYQGILRSARQSLLNRQEQATRQLTPANTQARVREIVAAFWMSNQLPLTQWSYRWRIDDSGQSRTELHAQQRGMSATFSAAQANQGPWSAPIAVSSLVSSLSLQIPIWTRRSKGTETKLEDLVDYNIIEIESSLSRQKMLLRRNGKAKHALLITLADAAQSQATISLVDEAHDMVGERHCLSVTEVEAMGSLWSLIQEHQDTLIDSRSQLSALSIDNRGLELYEHPAEIAEAFLSAIAPLAREIRMRSRVPGELILKKNTGEGRREELFLPRESLQALYEHLPERFTQVFDAMGLGQESTREFVTMLDAEHAHKQRRQRSVRVAAHPEHEEEAPPRRSSSARAIDATLAALGIEEGQDQDENTFNEPSVIVEFEAAAG